MDGWFDLLYFISSIHICIYNQDYDSLLGTVLAFLKCMESSVLAFLKCMGGSIWTHLNGTYGSVWSHLRFPTQSAPTRYQQLGNSAVLQLLCKKRNKTSNFKQNGCNVHVFVPRSSQGSKISNYAQITFNLAQRPLMHYNFIYFARNLGTWVLVQAQQLLGQFQDKSRNKLCNSYAFVMCYDLKRTKILTIIECNTPTKPKISNIHSTGPLGEIFLSDKKEVCAKIVTRANYQT